MKVIYEKRMYEQVREALHESYKTRSTIKHIVLTQKEAAQLYDERLDEGFGIAEDREIPAVCVSSPCSWKARQVHGSACYGVKIIVEGL